MAFVNVSVALTRVVMFTYADSSTPGVVELVVLLRAAALVELPASLLLDGTSQWLHHVKCGEMHINAVRGRAMCLQLDERMQSNLLRYCARARRHQSLPAAGKTGSS